MGILNCSIDCLYAVTGGVEHPESVWHSSYFFVNTPVLDRQDSEIAKWMACQMCEWSQWW